MFWAYVNDIKSWIFFLLRRWELRMHFFGSMQDLLSNFLRCCI